MRNVNLTTNFVHGKIKYLKSPVGVLRLSLSQYMADKNLSFFVAFICPFKSAVIQDDIESDFRSRGMLYFLIYIINAFKT